MKYDLHQYYSKKTHQELIRKILDIETGFYLHVRDQNVSYFGFEPKLFFSSEKSEKKPLEFLDEILREFIGRDKKKENSFFTGGFVGYLSYDLGKYLYNIPQKIIDDTKTPDFVLGLYEGLVIFDHKTNNIWICSRSAKDKKKYLDWLERGVSSPEEVMGDINLSSNMSYEDYLKGFNKIRRHLYDGDIYQVNFAQRFSFNGSLISRDLMAYKLSLEPHSAYLKCGGFEVFSFSPERFLQVTSQRIITQPIKGTVPRGKTAQEEQSLKKQLLNSEKDRAEHIMIVDLERNDLGKICKPGTVKVPELFKIKTFEKVHHLVSTIEGELSYGVTTMDIIDATFPGGSITGAPKKRAQEIIEDLEPSRRGIYTGSIGYIDFSGNLDLNIAIRTLIRKGNQNYFSVGGGIVIDSDPEKEFKETLVKGEMIVENLTSCGTKVVKKL